MREIVWTNEAEEAFEKCNQLIANAKMLANPVEITELALKLDASYYAIDAVVEQKVSGKWQPLAFYSKNTSPTEQNYSAYGRELEAVYLAVKHFRYMPSTKLPTKHSEGYIYI